MREFIPEGYDEHLLTLETLVRSRIKEHNLCLRTLMGEQPRRRRASSSSGDEGIAPAQAAAADQRTDTFQFAAQVPSKKLRCLNL